MKLLTKLCFVTLFILCYSATASCAEEALDLEGNTKFTKDIVVFVGEVISNDSVRKTLSDGDRPVIVMHRYQIKVVKKLWGDIEEGKIIIAERERVLQNGMPYFIRFNKRVKVGQKYLIYLHVPKEKTDNYMLPVSENWNVYGINIDFSPVKSKDEPFISALEKGIKFLTADNAIEEQIKILKSFLADENPYLQLFALSYIDKLDMATDFIDIIKKQYVDAADKTYAELFIKADKICSRYDRKYAVSDYRYKQFFKVLKKVQGYKYSRDNENDLTALDIDTDFYEFRYAREQIVAEIIGNGKAYNKRTVLDVIGRVVLWLPEDKKEPDKTTQLIIEYYISLLDDQDSYYFMAANSFFNEDLNRKIIQKAGIDKKAIGVKMRNLLERIKNDKNYSSIIESLKENLQFYK